MGFDKAESGVEVGHLPRHFLYSHPYVSLMFIAIRSLVGPSSRNVSSRTAPMEHLVLKL
jgi:hypothetical protein